MLLVDPYTRREDPMERKGEEQYPSLGILSVAAYLREHDHHVAVVDLTFERGLGPVRRAVRELAPDIVGVHTKTLTFPRAVEIGRLARLHGAVALAGGPDASSRPEAYLDAGFDVVATGEGETTMVDLARAVAEERSWFGIPGVAFRHQGKNVRGPPRPLLKDLDRLPLPAWDLIDMEGYLTRWERATGDRRMAVLTSRGCPFDCSWCSKPTFGRSFRQRSVESVMGELGALRERYDVDYVRICDDVFGIQRSWTERFLRAMVERRVGVRYECLSRVDLLKPDLLPRMKQAGLARVFLGVESGSQKMLDLMNRGTRLSQIERCSRALRQEGVRQYWFLMLGYPGETTQDIQRTLELFRRFSPEEYSVSLAVPLPGTRLEGIMAGGGSRTSEEGSPAAPSHLLFEGVYPVSLYRWDKARFAWSKMLRDPVAKFNPSLVEALEQAGDELGSRVVHRIVSPPPPGSYRPEGPRHAPARAPRRRLTRLVHLRDRLPGVSKLPHRLRSSGR